LRSPLAPSLCGYDVGEGEGPTLASLIDYTGRKVASKGQHHPKEWLAAYHLDYPTNEQKARRAVLREEVKQEVDVAVPSWRDAVAKRNGAGGGGGRTVGEEHEVVAQDEEQAEDNDGSANAAASVGDNVLASNRDALPTKDMDTESQTTVAGTGSGTHHRPATGNQDSAELSASPSASNTEDSDTTHIGGHSSRPEAQPSNIQAQRNTITASDLSNIAVTGPTPQT
jgi:hypothetical protein